MKSENAAGADSLPGSRPVRVGRRRVLATGLDRLTLLGIAAGLGILFQPWWERGFVLGFLVVAVSTLAQIVASHRLPRDAA